MRTRQPRVERRTAESRPSPAVAHKQTRKWRVLRVRARREQLLASRLTLLGIAHYLPVVAEERVYAGQHVRVEVPVFQGYVFVRADPDEWKLTTALPEVSAPVRILDADELEQRLHELSAAIANGSCARTRKRDCQQQIADMLNQGPRSAPATSPPTHTNE